ncbi:J domain-containing protein [Hyalangium rubrum]|uniref:J domain-containing protein n=1 Tax=Hyalangium rubrum TaxID=3103134 RepID=A0ABU5H891_9BACT|nr:J domain-containing protein [Hyalangium sp. s54d21]MDY7229685.1 J domain-containing protein [Hyalangium sp. s54d21]
MTLPDEPFAVLSMTPTLDLSLVKRAYFAALARHPPHQDPKEFQRVRGAYEALTRPGGLAAAYLASPVDVKKLASEARERFDALLVKAAQVASAERAGQEVLARFVERCSRMGWEEALRVCGAEPRH